MTLTYIIFGLIIVAIVATLGYFALGVCFGGAAYDRDLANDDKRRALVKLARRDPIDA